MIDRCVVRGDKKIVFLSLIKELTEASHERATYELTGSASYDYFEIADMISQAVGRLLGWNPRDFQSFALETRSA